MKKMDYEKFINKETKTAIIPGTIKNIINGSFWNKELKQAILQEGIEIIGQDAFRNNYLKEISIPSSIRSIKDFAFYGNDLTKLILQEGIEEIGDYAFCDNYLKNIQIPGSIKSIKYKAFAANQLESIQFQEGIENIDSYAFLKNKLTFLHFPKTIKKIDIGAFEENKLMSINFNESLEVIEDFAFYLNELTTLTFPKTIKKIGINSFANNQIKEIIFKEGIEEIESKAFINNNLKKVSLPRTIKKIGSQSFDTIDIEYRNLIIDKDMIKEFGTENIITIYNISKIVPFNIISKMPVDVMNIIPKDNDSIKGYYSNYKKFNNLIHELTLREDYINSYNNSNKKTTDFQCINIFKLCYILGYFHHNSKEMDDLIKKIIEDNGIDYVNQIMTTINLSEYDPKFKNVFMHLYSEKKIIYNDTPIIDKVYDAFKKIKKYTLKRHATMIREKNREYKKAKQQKKYKEASLLEQELNILKKNKKEISYKDIDYYLENNTFHIKDENSPLKQVIPELSIHINQIDFDKIQDIYEQSILIKKSIPLTLDKRDAPIKYTWLKGDDPINTVLGYLMNCCCKINDIGEDIMIQSMINPNIINLVIYDEFKQVLGKATAYHNPKENYILFNTIETKIIKNLGNKSAFIRKQESLLAILEAIKDVKEKLDIKEVRMGMQRNDLSDTIHKSKLVIEHKNLLDNYPWKGYKGDSNDSFTGQVILCNQDITIKDSIKKVKSLNNKNHKNEKI